MVHFASVAAGLLETRNPEREVTSGEFRCRERQDRDCESLGIPECMPLITLASQSLRRERALRVAGCTSVKVHEIEPHRAREFGIAVNMAFSDSPKRLKLLCRCLCRGRIATRATCLGPFPCLKECLVALPLLERNVRNRLLESYSTTRFEVTREDGGSAFNEDRGFMKAQVLGAVRLCHCRADIRKTTVLHKPCRIVVGADIAGRGAIAVSNAIPRIVRLTRGATAGLQAGREPYRTRIVDRMNFKAHGQYPPAEDDAACAYVNGAA